MRYSIENINTLVKKRQIQIVSDEYTRCDKKHEWLCRKCDHAWMATPSNVINRKSGCPKCAGFCHTAQDMKQLACKNNIEFISTEYFGMRKKHQWKCPDGHVWKAMPYHIKNGTGCPRCHSRINEEKCRFIFESLTGHLFPSIWNLFNKKMQLDGYCEELQLAFEYNGEQHYEKSHFHKNVSHFLKQKERDSIKTKLCIGMGITKIDVPYFIAKSNEELERYISSKLLEISDLTLHPVNWSTFAGKPRKLLEIDQIALKRNIKCTSKVYIDARTKILFECLVCNNDWKATPDGIKHGNGCPKCGYIKRVKSRRATMQKKCKELCCVL